jgi:hypothetical protein
VDINQTIGVQIRTVETNILAGKLKPEQEFRLGVFPMEIAIGKIKEVSFKL